MLALLQNMYPLERLLFVSYVNILSSDWLFLKYIYDQMLKFQICFFLLQLSDFQSYRNFVDNE